METASDVGTPVAVRTVRQTGPGTTLILPALGHDRVFEVREFKILNPRIRKPDRGQSGSNYHCTGPRLPNGAHWPRRVDIARFLHSLRPSPLRPLTPLCDMGSDRGLFPSCFRAPPDPQTVWDSGRIPKESTGFQVGFSGFRGIPTLKTCGFYHTRAGGKVPLYKINTFARNNLVGARQEEVCARRRYGSKIL